MARSRSNEDALIWDEDELEGGRDGFFGPLKAELIAVSGYAEAASVTQWGR